MKKYKLLKQTKNNAKNLFKEIKYEEIKYENLLLLLLVLLIVYFLITPKYFQMLQNIIESFGTYGYLGVFASGFFFTFAFTVPIATVVLIAFGSVLNPFLIALIGAAGATISDFIIFKISKRKLSREIEKLERKGFLKKHSKLVQHLAPLIAGFIIASPLPDEIGAAILGSMKFSDKKFIVFIFIVEFIGIFALATIGSII